MLESKTLKPKNTPPQRPLDVRQLLQQYGGILALVLLLVFNLLFTPNFLSMQTLNINLTQVATIVIVGVGMTLVIATGGIDLSVGSLMAIAGALAPIIFLSPQFEGTWLGNVLAFIVPILLAGLFGLFNGFLITRFQIQPIIATLVLFIAGRGIAQVMSGGNLQTFINPGFSALGQEKWLGIPIQVYLMVVVVALAAYLLRRTVFGRQLVSVGGNERAAELSGIPVRSVKLWVYGISGLLAGLAGLIVIAINSSSDANKVGQNMELDAIAAVAVGGTLLEGGKATIVGTLIGALIIQLIRYTLIAQGVPDAVALVVKGLIIVGAVALQNERRV